MYKFIVLFIFCDTGWEEGLIGMCPGYVNHSGTCLLMLCVAHSEPLQ